ncbi:hypothetical protein [Oryzibacter oryziterrae]|uniref:hypothetical protein n=1 Tax=Oryzibacter oryziterrae TaxID=2766474 RepID=UPI001F27A470|nr:hypothetical protein [Oryzibacter oryziterrae]
MMWNELRFMRGAVLALALAAAGCSSVGLGDVNPGTILTAGQTAGVAQQNVQKFAAVAVCPQIQVRDGTQLMQIFDKGKPVDGAIIRFQASINKFARECHTDPISGATTIKVGVFGRMLAGPKGGTGSATLPLRLVVVRNGDEVLYSQLFKIAATIPAGQASTEWNSITDGVVVPADKSQGNFVLYVGFDESGKK